MSAIQALLGRLIDDAGQFPPARLPLEHAIDAHRAAREGQWSWMVGRFLCPASRLTEAAGLPRPLGVVSDADWRSDLEAALAAGAESLELRDPGPDAYPLLGAAPLEVFVEAPASLPALETAGLAAKLRCGGLAPEAFPSDQVVAEFIGSCRGLGLPFKLTAGLHHPFRTADEELGVLQHGFVNVLAAAILELSPDQRVQVVAERDPAAFTVSPDGIGWNSEWARFEDVQRGRALFRAFGSCSFTEPLADLLAQGILDSRV